MPATGTGPGTGKPGKGPLGKRRRIEKSKQKRAAHSPSRLAALVNFTHVCTYLCVDALYTGRLTRSVSLRLHTFYRRAIAGKLKYVAVTAVGVAVGVDLYRFCSGCIRLDTMDRLKDLINIDVESVAYDSAGAEPTIIYDAR